MKIRLSKIVSGGQTGVDRAALDSAVELSIPYGGWIPKGRRSEEGPIPDLYTELKETDSESYEERTKLNVKDSDGTLLVSNGPMKGGSALTLKLAREFGRPFLHIDFELLDAEAAQDALSLWLEHSGCRTLNVAGPRSSEDETIYGQTRDLLTATLGKHI